MRFLTSLAVCLAHSWRQRPASLVDRGRAEFAMYRRSAATGYARSPIYAELDRRPGQVNWLVARAVTLQYR